MANQDYSENQTIHKESAHEHTLYSEPVFIVGKFEITNSLITSWIAALMIIVIALVLWKRIRIVPKGLQNVFEMAVEAFLSIFDSVTGSREKSMNFFPFVFSAFLFILINNWLGLLPGVGSISRAVVENGEEVLVPLFRGGTADLNTTLALASLAVMTSHIFGVIAVGAWHYFNKFVNINAFIEIPKKILKDPAILIVNPVKAFVSAIEIVSEISKVASLSFRLYGNIFAGEVLLASISALVAFGVPIPFMFLEILVGLVQAVIFSMLVLSYFSVNTSAEDH